ncbi:MAG TPA: hypothetical protein VGE37_12230 [Archangium sp.]
MRRQLVIVLGVLVPFALLVVAGFWFQPEEVKPGEIPVRPTGLSEPVEDRPDAGGEAQTLSPTLSPAGEREDAGVSFPPELRAPLTAVLPHVKRCFSDQDLKSPHAIRVSFTPTRDGGFSGVRVDEQNPYLAACLEDVFDEVSWHPEGPETYAPSQHTFSFDPSKD